MGAEIGNLAIADIETLWMFDQADMAKAKEIADDRVFIFGKMSSSISKLGTPQALRDYGKKRVDTANKGGVFFVGNGAIVDEAKPEVVKTVVAFTKEFRVYGLDYPTQMIYLVPSETLG
jgi:uroporphyrinogen-III decarboxylase